MSTIKLQSEYDDLDKYESIFGTFYYYKKDTDITHNPYGPAIIKKNGYKEYWVENKLHRLDGSHIVTGKQFPSHDTSFDDSHAAPVSEFPKAPIHLLAVLSASWPDRPTGIFFSIPSETEFFALATPLSKASLSF